MALVRAIRPYYGRDPPTYMNGWLRLRDRDDEPRHVRSTARRHAAAGSRARSLQLGRFGNIALCTSICCLRATPAARPVRKSRLGCLACRPAIPNGPGGNWLLTTRWLRFTAGSAITRARGCATGRSWTARCRSTRSSGFWAIERGWLFALDAVNADQQVRPRAGREAVGRPGVASPSRDAVRDVLSVAPGILQFGIALGAHPHPAKHGAS
jgi:hypothetical protein